MPSATKTTTAATTGATSTATKVGRVVVAVLLAGAVAALLWAVLAAWQQEEGGLALPCPVSYAEYDEHEELHLTEAECEARSCVWNSGSGSNRCSLPSNDVLGYKINGAETVTAKGFKLPLIKTGGGIFQDQIESVTFELFQHSNEILQIKLYDTNNNERFEVPISLNYPTSDVDKPSYKMKIRSEIEGEPFSFSVIREATGTVLFDTGIGGLILEDQFLSISSTLPSRNVYGLGENNHATYRHPMDSKFWSIWARDQPPATTGELLNLYGSHPFYECIEDDGNAHGVLLLNSNGIDYQVTDHPSITLRTIGGILDLYFFLGPEPEQVTSEYTGLVGRPFIPPYWALGFQLCRYGYENTDDIKAAVERTTSIGIPLDVQYADIDYMEIQKDFTIDQENFADLPSYVRELKKDGVKFIVILDPAINAELGPEVYPPHHRAMAGDVYTRWPNGSDPDKVFENNLGLDDVMLGFVWPENRTAFPNWHSSDTAAWWGDEIRMFYDKLPFDGLWIDMNEPAVFDTNLPQPWNWPDWQQESWNLHCPHSRWDDPPYVTKAGWVGASKRMSDKTLCLAAWEAPYRHYDAHNLHGWQQARLTHRALQAVTGRRGAVISRSTFVGSGQWAGHWLGDNTSGWEDLRRSIVGMLEFGLFGIPYVGADICGFFADASEELCGRWMLLGAFYPFSRNHNGIGQAHQDPGIWPDTVGRWSAAILTERYRLLPFLYTLFYEAHTEGSTVVRALAHEFPQDNASLGIDSQFLWGAALLVSPVLTEGATGRSLHLPPAVWYDYFTGSRMAQSGEEVWAEAPQGILPLHVRGGHVLPLQAPGPNTEASSRGPVGVLVAPGEQGGATGHLFWDDLSGVATVEEGRYGRVLYEFAEDTLNTTVIADYDGILSSLKLDTISILGVATRPAGVKVDGAEAPGATLDYTSATQRLLLTLDPVLPLAAPHSVRLLW